MVTWARTATTGTYIDVYVADSARFRDYTPQSLGTAQVSSG